MAWPAVTAQTEGFWVGSAGSGEESSAALNARTQAGLTGPPGDRVAIKTLHTPVAVWPRGVLPALDTLSCVFLTLVRQAVALTGSTERESPESFAAAIAPPACDVSPTGTLTSDLLTERIRTSSVALAGLAAVGSKAKRQRSTGITATANHIGFTFTDSSQFTAGRTEGTGSVTPAADGSAVDPCRHALHESLTNLRQPLLRVELSGQSDAAEAAERVEVGL